MEYLPYYSNYSMRRLKVTCLVATATIGLTLVLGASQAYADTTTTVVTTTTTSTTPWPEAAGGKIVGVKMRCYPHDAKPYTVSYNFGLRSGYITSAPGLTRTYAAVSSFHSTSDIMGVTVNAPGQTRTLFLGFDFSRTVPEDVSELESTDGLAVKRDSCVFGGAY